MSNRLAGAASPYLAQHQDNPVDWWPWGPEAFAEATRRDVPVFLSIGYAACHWCHVMAHESFEDAATAELMNSRYVCIKVDREEHPEVDAVYMTAIQVQGEGGGWPLSAWCTADARPYFMGTYFPTTARHGRPSFGQVLTVMADAYRDKRDDVLDNVAALAEGLHAYDAHHRKGAAGGDVAALNESLLIAAGRTIVPRCDGKNGGLGGAPKFPNATALAALRVSSRLPFGTAAAEAATMWLRGMTERGLYDQLGGGFARYCVDAGWAVPHFEKMLYDNAQLLAACADGISGTKSDSERARLTEVIAETVGFFARELSDPGGGLWSSLDADSEGEEGKFYVWTPDSVRSVLGPVDAMLFCNAYNVTDKGNFEHGTTVLARATPRGSDSDEALLIEMRARLLAARSARIRPGTDDKVLAGWNGLAISGLLAAWRVTGNNDARAMAVRVGEFIVREMLRGDDLARMWKAGQTYHLGTLDDYAMVAAAMLDLAEATGDAAWWQRGASLLTALRARFVGEVDNALVLFLSAADGETLVHRPESNQDGATPSGASVAVAALLRVGLVAGDADALALAERYLAERLSAGDPQAPITMPGLYVALGMYLHHQVVVISDGTGADELATAARGSGAPGVMLAGPWAQASYRDGRGPTAGGRAQAYACRGVTCQLPVSDAAALTTLLSTTA